MKAASTLLSAFTTALLVTQPAAGQDLPALQPEDYDRWETLGAPTVHPFARFVAHTVRRVDEKSELRIRSLDPDTTWTIPWGLDPQFSADGRWVVWSVGVSPEERERLQDADERVEQTLWLLDLDRGGEPSEVGTARGGRFGPEGRFLAVHGYADPEAEGDGSALRILDLHHDSEVSFSEVAEMAWAPVEPLLAMTLETGEDQGNGVQLYNAGSGVLRGLDASGSAYLGLTWRDDSSDLAVFRTTEAASEDGDAVDVLVWRGAGQDGTGLELAATSDLISDTLEVVRHRGPTWSDDGMRIELGLRPRDVEEADSAEADSTSANETPEEDPATVQIWHTSDVDIIPAQKVGASRADQRTLAAVWNLDAGTVVQVGQSLEEISAVTGSVGIERRADPYPWGAKFGRRYHDMWTVDLETGHRTHALERVRYSWTSPGGRYLVWFDGEHYRLLAVGTADTVNLTEGATVAFANTSWDTPTDGVLPPHGLGGWMEDDRAVLLNDQFDVWRFALDGSGSERLTQGREDDTVHRVQDLDPTSDAFAADEALLFSLRNEWTEDRGFALVSSAGYQRLLLEPKSFWSVQRADSVDRVVYRRESRTDAPDLYIANSDFSNARVVTESNPFMSEYAWTRTELIEYQNAEGTRLHGTLLYPVNHDPAKDYPMIVFAYELLTPQMHLWQGPSERSYYNYITWAQQGYFVLLPDIVFRARDPGVSTAETMDAAIRAVDARGLIDRERVGFIGHSWGGYEATFLAARTELFATAVAGAPLTDFVSFMGSIHWNPGIAEVDHWETGQARMEVPYWEDPDAHERNSPIHGVHTMTTPLLMAHGDDDGVVEFFQATEFFNFARRAEREMVLLVYEGEDHGFRQEANQIDYDRRILEWFGHYLKGNPAPSWIQEGVRWADHEDERARLAKGSGS